MNFKNLNFETIKNDAKRITFPNDDSYLQAYPKFIKYFREIKQIEKHHLIIASHFVYGWMPTILNLDISNLGKVLSLLNKVKSGHLLKAEELEILKKCINNSLVGLSKLLHFINPKIYAIWDSRIYRYMTEKKSTYGIDKSEFYLEYLDKIKGITEHNEYSSLHNQIGFQFDYKLQPTRVIELIMFEKDRQN